MRGLGPVVVLERRGRDGLDIDAHLVHVLQARFDRGQHLGAVLHLLFVGGARQVVGVDEMGIVLRRVQVHHGGGDVGIEIVAMQVDARNPVGALFRGFRGRGEFAPDRGLFGRRLLPRGGAGMLTAAAVPVVGIGAALRAGVHHDRGSPLVIG